MRRLLALSLWLAAVAAGCGFGAGAEQNGGAELRVTRDFGQEQLAAHEFERIREDQTVMRLLQSEHDVETRFGGKFVQAIDGLDGSQTGQRDWFYFVNGIEADRGAADWELHPGDVVQWDHRPWSAAQRIPAIVGAFPEPFRSGSGGDRIPVRLECADPTSQPCSDVKQALTKVGAPVSASHIGASGGGELVRVLVGRWDQLRDVRSATILEKGPGGSGVFARFTSDGERLELLDESGEVAQVAADGSGLLAATALEEQGVVWVATGLQDIGVEAAAALLDERTLRNAFAVAATPDGPLKLPLGATE